MSIQAVFFDMGGTIETFWYNWDLRMKATPELQQKLAAAGIELNLDDSALCHLISDGFTRYHSWSLQSSIELPTFQVWRDYILAGCTVNLDCLAAAAEELTYWYETHYFQREMRPEMPAVLDEIRRSGLKIGLISNVCSHSQVPRNLEAYGIKQFFNPVVLSSQYGRRKPDPAIFHYAARLANIPASGCVYVGDRVARDIDGARRAGFGLAIQIRNDFNHGESDAGPEPDAIIEDMRELLEILLLRSQPTKARQTEREAAEPKIRGILFDAGDILYYRSNLGIKFRDYLASLGISLKEHPGYLRDTLRRKAYRGEISQEDYHREVLTNFGIKDPTAIQSGLKILKDEQNDISIFEGVSSTLRSLKQNGYLLGIITDTSQPLHNKLKWFEQNGFGDVWDSIIASNELGFCKPDPRIYQAALQQLGLLPSQAVFVGHKKTELDGARAVGLRTIAFNQEKAAIADLTIKKFSDLCEFFIPSPRFEGIR